MSPKLSTSTDLGGREVIIETGLLAKQAQGAVTVRCGDTIVLVTACATSEAKVGIDFVPLTVDYQERTFAAGKIPGGFFKREGKPSEKETLTSRLIDRPIRPLFPDGWACETQVIATVLSADPLIDPDVLAITGASAALSISEIPFNGPIGGCRIGRVDGKLIINPTGEQLDQSDLEIVLAASEHALVMVEGGAYEVPEAEVWEALQFGHEAIKKLIRAQKELADKVGTPKRSFEAPAVDAALDKLVRDRVTGKLKEAFQVAAKQERNQAIKAVKEDLKEAAIKEDSPPELAGQVSSLFKKVESEIVREKILKEKRRIDGRDLETVRPISIETGLLPRTHGSALFTRGETQALVTATLGTSDDVQIIDTLLEEGTKHFMLHYNFPPFSVGEVKFLRGPGRREIGHGALAERAVTKVLPAEEDFPYTIRIVSEILESNGSSSMASVCGASLAMMDAGIPVSAPVAGIAMGLINEGDNFSILSDILGDEDHLGDMDFKVAGTEKGVTAVQMDIKIEGLPPQVMVKALEQARRGRMHILGEMKKAMTVHRPELSPYAPRIEVMQINKDKIREVIGPGGKVIRNITEQTGVKIDIEDDGTIHLYSPDADALKRARRFIENIVAEAEVGVVYRGKVRRIVEFGAFVEILPGTDGLVHISEISKDRIRRVSDVLHEGDEVIAKCIRIDRDGKVSLSMKQAEGMKPTAEGSGGDDRAQGQN